MRRFLTACAIALSLGAHPLSAQAELGAFVGVFAPTSEFVVPPPSPFASASAKIETQFTYGGVGRYWFGSRVGAQVTYSAGQGNLVVYSLYSSPADTTYDATTGLLTLQFLYSLSTPSLPNTLWASIGPAWSSLDSPYLDGAEIDSDVGVAIGLGSTLPVFDRRLLVNFMIDGVIWGLSVSDSTSEGTRSSQFAIRAVVGATVPIGR